jgi:hypothetical protein
MLTIVTELVILVCSLSIVFIDFTDLSSLYPLCPRDMVYSSL